MLKAIPAQSGFPGQFRARTVDVESPMRRLLLASVIALSPVAAQAGELKPTQAHSIDLNGVHGVAYYTVEDGDYHVVAVVAHDGGTPVRVSAHLADGQSVVISVPGAVGSAEATLEIVRDGDAVSVSPTVVALN
jgi:hypothetical protein